ncbi:hypothetical protein J1605_021378 [Eschrichtius robustus]|uniref:Uncharacterized protein n=1 Tax=Eschrichtius robustus TaxID=9764 RepID=A0AB34HBX3_ESCRO|nr:hypothetical protein J1605_021378 [Eschrichtius robustus]
MFRVQFSGGSKEQALEHCCSCVQNLAQYLTVQVPDGISQELRLSPSPLWTGESQGKGRVQSIPPQHDASLVAQWLRICLLMQGTRVRAPVWEDPTCRGATRPVSHNY